MKRYMAALVLAGTTTLAAGCGDAPDDDKTRIDPVGPATAATAETPESPMAGPTAMEVAPASTDTAPPTFAVLYPGATVVGDPVVGTGDAGTGGIVTFTTEAGPDTVIAFYRERAEAAGLSSVMAMNQGDARAYGAVKAEAGANLQVVASPGEAGQTSVQLSWSGG